MTITKIISLVCLLILIGTYFYKNRQMSTHRDHDLELIEVEHVTN